MSDPWRWGSRLGEAQVKVEDTNEAEDWIAGPAEGVDPELLALLVCPVDRADLRAEVASLTCTRCGRVYPIEDGIPNMLVDEA